MQEGKKRSRPSRFARRVGARRRFAPVEVCRCGSFVIDPRFTGARSAAAAFGGAENAVPVKDRKSTRLNSSHSQISYAVFCLKKKKKQTTITANTYKHQTQANRFYDTAPVHTH